MPPSGTLIFLRNNANLSTGGSATDVTDEVHPEMAARAVSAARMIGLDICGVEWWPKACCIRLKTSMAAWWK